MIILNNKSEVKLKEYHLRLSYCNALIWWKMWKSWNKNKVLLFGILPFHTVVLKGAFTADNSYLWPRVLSTPLGSYPFNWDVRIRGNRVRTSLFRWGEKRTIHRGRWSRKLIRKAVCVIIAITCKMLAHVFSVYFVLCSWLSVNNFSLRVADDHIIQ